MSPESTFYRQLREVETSHEVLKVELTSFSQAKDPQHPEKNEDLFAHNDTSFVLADGSTPKRGNIKEINGKSGGAIAAEIVAKEVLGCDLNSRELVDRVTAAIQDYYRVHYPEALEDPQQRFATTLLAARIVEEQLIITQVGDTGFRINGGEVYTERRKIDKLDAITRTEAIKAALAAGHDEETSFRIGREYIQPSLNQQYLYRNNPDHELGFGYIDGGEVPDKFIKTYSIPLTEVKKLEIFSDGYIKYPAKASIEAWENKHAAIQKEDPYRYKKYPATKPADDRTIAIIEFTHLGQNSAA